MYMLFLPPLTFTSLSFWMFLLIALFIYGVLLNSISYSNNGRVKVGTVVMLGTGLVALLLFGGRFFNSPIFRSREYADMIEVEEKIFESDFPENDTSGIPLMDRDTATRLGDRQIGGMSELVSQFVPAKDYIQINIEDTPYRVSPLEYASFLRWWNNRHEGVPGYIKVNMVDGKAEIIDLDDPIKYSHGEYFGRDVKRHLRLKHPSLIFGEPSFEVDDEGHPHYVATTYETKFFFNYEEPNGVITLDAVTGETTMHKLDESPQWIDRVYSARLVIEQLDNYGKFQDGYLNTWFGKQGVTRTTEGYNYLSLDGDIYIYTGVTSVNSDASNIGFYLVNMRTKEAHYYPVVSADEYSAMDSAVGSVQQMRYESTFPILIKLHGRPFYLSSLKDDSGLVRLYALVDAQDYQKVYTGNDIDEVLGQLNYDMGIEDQETIVEEVETEEELVEFSGRIDEISQTVVSGDAVYYFLIDGSVYKADVKLHDLLPFVKDGYTIEGQIDEKNNFKEILELNPSTE